MDPNAPRETLSDDAVVAYLRDRAPGLPPARFDARAVTVRARTALRRLRRRRIGGFVLAATGAASVYLVLLVAGPLSVPGVGPVSMPGADAFRGLVRGILPAVPPGPGQWSAEVDRLDAEVRPVVERLEVDYYIMASPTCRILEYPRGDFRDGGPDCADRVPFDARARADYDEVTDAVERTGVPVERIYRDRDGLHVRLEDFSVQYNWEYVYRPDADAPPATRFPGEAWTRVRGDWWFFRAHDD